jgi:hypothetical protein
VNGFSQLTDLDFARQIFVGTGFVFERGDATDFMPIQPGADGAPGELISDILFRIVKRLLCSAPNSSRTMNRIIYHTI